MSDKVSCILNMAYTLAACELGQSFNVYRTPGDLVIDQTPTLIATTSLNVVPGGFRNAIPNMFGVSYFLVTGDRTKFVPGDILIPVNPLSSLPPMTVLSYDDGIPCVSFRTSRICNIVQNIDTDYTTQTPLYTNVRFDFILYTTPESGVIDKLSDALGMPNTKAVLWTRSGIQPQNLTFPMEGCRLIEADGVTPVRWVIKGITQVGNLTVFNLVKELD